MSPTTHQKVFDEEHQVDLSKFPDRIAETFSGKTVFITGATGFVGKALVERILHNTEVKKIYILIKSKRGEDAQIRFAKYFDNYFFGPLREDRPESIKKVEAIQGDLSGLDLEISKEDRRKLADEVNFIYHSGASVRFDEHIKKIILLNVRGTRNMVTFAKEAKNLEMFVHVSTTFCQPRGVVLEERQAATPHNPHEMITIAENIDNGTLSILAMKLIAEYGNSYTYSKALAEAIVFEEKDNLPIMVLRPSIIMPCLKSPIPGYTDSVYGTMGSWLIVGKGIMHVTRVNFENKLEYITLDMFINAAMITTHNYINNTAKKVVVCNVSTFSWKTQFIFNSGLAIIEESPFKMGLGYPWVMSVDSAILYSILVLFIQILPAYILDFALMIFGRKMKQSFVEIQRKLARTSRILEFYSLWKKWEFNNDTIRHLQMDLNEREDDLYPLNIEDFDALKYGQHIVRMLMQNVLGEKIEDIPKNKVHLKRIKIIHYILKSIIENIRYAVIYLASTYATEEETATINLETETKMVTEVIEASWELTTEQLNANKSKYTAEIKEKHVDISRGLVVPNS